MESKRIKYLGGGDEAKKGAYCILGGQATNNMGF
jgi:hypothetical protein